MSDEKRDILESTYQAFAETNSIQHQTQQNLNDKAVEIVKVNLLVGSIVTSAISVGGVTDAVVYFAAGAIALLTSVWFSAKVFSQTRRFYIGLHERAAAEAKSESDIETHYRKLMGTYRDNVKDFSGQYKLEAKFFEIGLWAAVAALFYFFAGVGRIVLVEFSGISHPLSVDLPIVLIIGIVVTYGKNATYGSGNIN